MELDGLDREIVNRFQQDCRVSVSKLSRELKKPRSTIVSRLARLKDEGFFKGYRAIVDPRKLGYNFVAYVLMKVRRVGPIGGRSNQIILAEKLIKEVGRDRTLPWIEEAHIVTGPYDILLKVRVKSWEQLSRFLIIHLAGHEDVVHTETILALETVVEGSIIPP